MPAKIVAVLIATLVLAACSSAPKIVATHEVSPAAPASIAAPGSGGYLSGDGPDNNVPANLDATPDAVPKAEPLHRYANHPYKVLGEEYVPLTTAGSYKKRGIASWYGKKFNGHPTSSGEKYDMYAMSAAHMTLPIPSYARVTNTANGKSVIVRINDRGPFMHDRIIDLSYAAAHKLGIIAAGSGEVEVESLRPDAKTTSVNTPIAAPDSVVSAPLAVAADVSADSAVAAPVGNVYLQLAAFKTETSAQHYLSKMQAQLTDLPQRLSIHRQDGLLRVQLGPYASLDEARDAAEKLRVRLGTKPFVSTR